MMALVLADVLMEKFGGDSVEETPPQPPGLPGDGGPAEGPVGPGVPGVPGVKEANTFPRNVILIGFSGTGKTQVGREVARLLGWEFVDTDEEIERTAGRPVRRIFAEEGEPAFRDRERAQIREACRGGAPGGLHGRGCAGGPREPRHDAERRRRRLLGTPEPSAIYRRLVEDAGNSVAGRPHARGVRPLGPYHGPQGREAGKLRLRPPHRGHRRPDGGGGGQKGREAGRPCPVQDGGAPLRERMTERSELAAEVTHQGGRYQVLVGLGPAGRPGAAGRR